MLCFLLVFSASIVSAQAAKITGKVIDADTRKHLAGVNIVIEGTGMGAATDNNGIFSMNIEPGKYNITVSIIGYETKKIRKIEVVPGENTLADIELRPMALSMEEVVVTASRGGKKPYELPIATTVVDEQEISNGQDASTVEALKAQPGIWAQSSTIGSNGSVSIRGFTGKQIVTMFDGIRTTTSSIQGGQNDQLTDADILDVNGIEVIKGPGSAFQGSDAIGGVVNVVTEKNPSYTEKLKLGGRLYSKYSTVDSGKSIRGEARIASPHLFLTAGISRTDLGNLRAGGSDSTSLGLQVPSSSKQRDWDAQANYLFNDNHQLQFSAKDHSCPESRDYRKLNDKVVIERQTYKLSYEGKNIGFMENLKTMSYLQKRNREKFTNDIKTSTGPSKMLGSEIQATSFPSNNFSITYGVHLHRDSITGMNPETGVKNMNGVYDNKAIFAVSEWQASKKIQLNFNIREDFCRLKTEAPPIDSIDPLIKQAIDSSYISYDNLNIDKTHQALTGSAGFIFALHKNLNIVGNVGRAFRAGNYNEVCASAGTRKYGVPNDGSIKPEYSLTWESGIRPHTNNFSAGLTYFNTTLYDCIQSVPGTFAGEDSFTLVSGGKEITIPVYVLENASAPILVQGIEADWDYLFPELKIGALSIYGNFTWMEGKDEITEEPLAYASPTNGLGGIRWDRFRNSRDWNTWISFDSWIVGEFDDIPQSTATKEEYWVDPQDKTSGIIGGEDNPCLPGFYLLNLRGGIKWKFLSLKLAVENIANRKYRVKDERIDGPGRNFSVAVEMKI